jgi:S-adenosylmethionine:tRNA ribosyltransferase-isomerase
MKLSLFDYDLPPEMVAQFPARKRDESRLMVLDRSSTDTEILPFKRILDYPQKGDALVVNNTKVFKARLFGHRATGGKVEVFLVRKVDEKPDETWEALIKPSRRVHPGESIRFSSHSVKMAQHVEGGRWLVQFDSKSQREKTIAKDGHVPLPQYIKRDDITSDIRRYQTMFARKTHEGAVAAPTAGFHFTKPVIDKLKARGVKLIETTLHVGPGTFKPVQTDDIEQHYVDPEFAELKPQAARRINAVRAQGGKIYVVGTTSVRTLESAPFENNEIQPFAGFVDLYIKPGFEFKITDHLVTNFHLPKSSLMILVSAFAGREPILRAYQKAIEEQFRFYSYGDAMLIL